MLPLCLDQGVGVVPWSPLARGRLTRDWDASTARSETDEFGRSLYRDEDRDIVAAVASVAERLDLHRVQVALAWLLSQEAVTAPIVGVTRPEHLDDVVAAVAVRLSPEDAAVLEAPYRPHSIAGHA